MGKSTKRASVVFVMLYFLNCGEGEQRGQFMGEGEQRGPFTMRFLKTIIKMRKWLADLKNLTHIPGQYRFYFSFFSTLKYMLIFRMRTHML